MRIDPTEVRYAGGIYGNGPITAEDHRHQALLLLKVAEVPESAGGDKANRIAAAQVHATLALTAPEAAGTPEGSDR